MDLTLENTLAIIDQLLADNNEGAITALDGRNVARNLGLYTQQVEAQLKTIVLIANQARDDRIVDVQAVANLVGVVADVRTIAERADVQSMTNRDEIATLKEAGAGGGTQTDDDIREAREEREANTSFREAQLPLNEGYRTDINANALKNTQQDSAIGTAQTTADDARTVADRADGKADVNAGINAGLRADVDNLKNAAPPDSGTTLNQGQLDNINKIPTIVDDIGEEGAVGQQGTGIKGDIKALKATDDEIIGRLDGIGEGTFDVSDLETAHGVTQDFNPGTAYRGSNDQEFVDNNPGTALHRATGSFVIPAITLTADDGTDLPAGTPIKLSGALLNPGLTGRTVGFNPIMYYVIEQGTNRLVGRGAVDSAGTDQEVARDWAVADSVDSFTELNLDIAVTGTDIIVRWIAIYNGEDATLVPRLSHFNISFIGQYVAPIVDIVNNNTGDIRNDITDLQNSDRLLEGGISANAVELAGVKGNVESNTTLINGVRTKLAKPSFEAINEATVIPVDTETLDATALNNTLGGGSPFAKRLDRAIDTATKFTTLFDQPEHILSIGGGQIARVLAGRMTLFQLREASPARTDTSEARYITTPQGLGSRNRPAVLEFGVSVPGQVARSAQDAELFLDTGIPTAEANQTISNISMAFAVRTNGNWTGVSETLQFTIRSGQVRDLAVPGVSQITFRATGLADGRIRCQALHNGGVANANDIVTNGGAIRFDAGYTIDTAVARVERGQTAIDLGAYTGTNIITVDTIQAGDSDTLTVMVITADRVINTGYFLRESARTSFGTENSQFTIYETEPNIAITPTVLSQLDATDPYLGLFARTNHHADVLRLLKGLQVPTSDGVDSYQIADQIRILLNRGGSGEGLSMAQIEEIVRVEINSSTTIQANTAKVGIRADQALDIAETKTAVFGDVIAGIWDEGDAFDGSLAEAQALRIGDIVQSTRDDGSIEYYELLVQNITTATSTFYPGGGGTAGTSNTWKIADYTEGLVETTTGLDTRVTTAQNTANSKTTPAEAKAEAVTAINESLVDGEAIAEYVKANAGSGGGGTLTDEQIRSAIAGSTEAEPYNYKLKFASDIVNQVALPFLTGYNALKSFSAVGLVVDAPERQETELVIPLVNQSVPNNVLADIPFQTMPEGTITVNTLDNGALYVRGILRTTHNAGDVGNEFVVDRSTEIRTVNNGAVIFNFADFFSSVELSDEILARFPSGDTQQLKLDFVVQVFDDPALTQQRARSANTGLFTVQVNDVGISFLQSAPIIGVGGSGEASGVSLEAVANEMRANGDEATVPAETQPAPAQITATNEAQTDITVPDNALFRSPSTVNATISSNIINANNSITIGIRYTDDDSIAVALTPRFTDNRAINIDGIDLTRPIAFYFGVGEIQTITFTDVSFTNEKIGTGSLVDEIEQIGLNSLAEDTGETGVICTVRTGSQSAVGQAQLVCSDETPLTGTATFGGELRFTSSLFSWNGSFLFDGLNVTATRTSPDGDTNQVWRFDGIVWDFTDRDSRFVTVVPGEAVPFTFRGEIIGALSGDAYKIVRDTARTIVLDQVASDITIGGDPVMGGGARYRTFFRDLTSAQLGAGSTQTFAIPSPEFDTSVTYVTWACIVLTASTTASNATLWGGDIGASANDRGAVSLNLQNRGDGGSHSFGIARQTHGNAVRIGARTGTPSSETVVRVSITVRQGGLLKLPS